MINLLETVKNYNDSWNLTFYFIGALALLIGAFWTYMQVFVKPHKKKVVLKENVIYQNSEDTIEESTRKYEPKKTTKSKTKKEN